jgi:hypothetical protein
MVVRITGKPIVRRKCASPHDLLLYFPLQSDYLGRMQEIYYPDGETVSYEYGHGGQITRTRNGSSFQFCLRDAKEAATEFALWCLDQDANVSTREVATEFALV